MQALKDNLQEAVALLLDDGEPEGRKHGPWEILQPRPHSERDCLGTQGAQARASRKPLRSLNTCPT